MSDKEKTTSFAGEVWNTLSALNVNEHTEKKQQLTYLSWAWAWGSLMEIYPESYYAFEDEKTLPNGSCECAVNLTIKDGDRELTRRMWLPVMNYKNQAQQNPTTVEINKTRMRCLAKAMAMFGLGHYIYAGEDLPQDEKAENAAGNQQTPFTFMPEKEFNNTKKYVQKQLAQGLQIGQIIAHVSDLAMSKNWHFSQKQIEDLQALNKVKA